MNTSLNDRLGAKSFEVDATEPHVAETDTTGQALLKSRMSPDVLSGRVDAETGNELGTEGESRRVATILFLHPGPAPLHSDPPYNMHFHLGKRLQGGAVYGSWAKTRDECEQWREQIEPACGGFSYLPVPTMHTRPRMLRPLLTVFSMYAESLRYARASKTEVQAVIGYSPYGVGLAALLVARKLGVPLIIQVQNDLRAAYEAQPGRLVRVKRYISRRLARFVLNRAQGWHIYFPEQTGSITPRGDQKLFFLPDFTPVSGVPRTSEERREFLLVGYPWSVKGVDIAIRAFLAAGEALASWRLRIVGHCPDRGPFESLAAGDRRIEFEDGILHKRALEYIANCGVYVLASRTEAMPRVVIEAMAASRPIIATRVGGVPTYVVDESTGLLVEPQNVAQLSAAMVRLAGDEALRRRLGASARARIEATDMEPAWVARFADMVEQVAGLQP